MPAKVFADVLVAAHDIPVGTKIWIAVVFVAVVAAVFALLAAVVTPKSVLGARLRALGGQEQTAEKLTVWERIKQVLDYISKANPLSPRAGLGRALEGGASSRVTRVKRTLQAVPEPSKVL